MSTQHQETLNIDRLLDNLITRHDLMNQYNDETVSEIVHICNMVFSPVENLIDCQYVRDRLSKLKSYQIQLEKLKQLPHIQQRSQEWYDIRKNIITASDFAQALGEGKFGTQKQIYQKKCGYEEEKFNSNLPPLKWGIMFEPVASKIYEMRMRCSIHEFGLIQHPRIAHFGASPDGITDYGIMVEIKCPFKRKITGEVPLQYYYQVQGQLDVCGLEECDYMECEFSTYDTEEDFVNDKSFLYERGIVIETSDGYVYSDVIVSNKDLNKLMDWFHDFCENNDERIVAVNYWKLAVFNVVRIYKNQSFLDEKLEMLSEVWNKIKTYQNDKSLYDAEIKSSSSTRASKSTSNNNTIGFNKVQLTGYSFLPT